jgi:hypothetical protein
MAIQLIGVKGAKAASNLSAASRIDPTTLAAAIVASNAASAKRANTKDPTFNFSVGTPTKLTKKNSTEVSKSDLTYPGILLGAAKELGHQVIDSPKAAAVDTSKQVVKLGKQLVAKPTTSQQRQAILSNQTAAAKNPEYVAATKGLNPNHNSAEGVIEAQKLAAKGAKAKDIKAFLDQDAAKLNSQTQKGINAAVNIAGVSVGSEGLAGKLIGMKGAAADVGKAQSLGELAGNTVKSAAKPYINPIDKALATGLSKTGSALVKSVEHIPGGKAVTGAINAARDKIGTQFIDSNHPLLKVARSLDKSDRGSRERNTRLLFGDIAGSERRADHAIDNSENVKAYRQAITGMGKNTDKARADAAEYSAAKRQIQLIDAGRKEGKAASPEVRQAAQDTVDRLYQKYGDKIETARKANIAFQREGTQKLTGVGHSEKQFNDWLESDPEYQRTQFEQPKEKLNNPNSRTGSGGNVNISGQKLNKFATGKAVDPFVVGVQRAHQIEKYLATQRFKKHAVDLLKEAGHPVQELRTTAKTLTRKEAQQFLSDSRPASKQIAGYLRKNNRELRVIQRQLDSLNKKGLDVSLSKTTDDTLAGKLVDAGVSMSPREVKNVVSSLISTEPSELARIRAQIARRDPKAAALIDEIGKLKDEAEAFGAVRSGAYNDILKNKDLSAHGMPTITYDEQGIRNSFRVPEKFANAANQSNVKSAPEFLRKTNNVFKYGTTQGNPAFAIPNFLKDQVSSYFNSESAANTHNPVNVAVSLLHTMTGGRVDGSGLYKTFSEGFGESRRIDINRNLKKGVRDVNKGINGERNLAGKARNLTVRKVVGAPFHANNSIIGKLEETTRFQNYRGTYNLYRRKGYSDAEAKTAALRASRENSTDFNPAGETGRFLNGISPYLNAGIQGGRTIGRSLRERPATTSAKLTAVAAPVLALTQWNLSDPQRAATYAQLPDYVKNNNFVITIGNKNYLIPMSQEATGIAGVYRDLTEAHFGKNPTSFMKEAKNFAKNISPVQADNPTDAIASVLPGPIKTGLELGTNKDFYTGNQIIPDYLKQANPNPQDQKYPNSSGISKLLGRITGASPIQTDYALKNTIGSGGQQAINTIPGNNGARGLVGGIEKRFVYSGSSNVKSQFNNTYYPLKDATDARRKSIYGLIKDGQNTTATRKADQYNDLVDQAKQNYVKQYGQFADPNDIKKFDSLKISILTSKKGKKYVKF